MTLEDQSADDVMVPDNDQTSSREAPRTNWKFDAAKEPLPKDPLPPNRGEWGAALLLLSHEEQRGGAPARLRAMDAPQT